MHGRSGHRLDNTNDATQAGALSQLTAKAWARMRQAWSKGGGFSQSELELASGLVDLLSFQEDWYRVMELSSRMVVQGCGPKARLRFYHAWIEGLRATHDVEALQSVGKHLLAQRNEGPDYIALACQALALAGRRAYARVLYGFLVKRVTKKSALVWESIAIWLSESPAYEERQKGIHLFARLCRKRKNRYFTLKNYLTYSLESDELEHAAAAYNAIHQVFPYAPDPFLADARIAISEGDFSRASVVLQELLRDNPEHKDGLLALADCLEKTGDLLAARDVLLAHADTFGKDDYDFAVGCASVFKSLYHRYGVMTDRNEAVRFYHIGLKHARKMKLPESALHNGLHVLGAGVGERQVASKGGADSQNSVWMLLADERHGNAFLAQKERILRVPEGLQKGHRILLARPNPRLAGVEIITAILEVTSPVMPDSFYGFAAAVKVLKSLPAPIEVELHDVRIAQRDAWGCENFSDQGLSRFYELPLNEVQELLSVLEHSQKRRASDFVEAPKKWGAGA